MHHERPEGKVYLVGAGPGDVDLITVKGLECIKKAQVLIYDRLASGKFINYTGKNTELIFVGKSPETHAYTQEEINKIIVQKAKEGYTVTRLKGGDPFVFGRGGEEALMLYDEGIDYEVVPGITSAVAAPLYAGIPVTHRGISSSLAVITGHEDLTKEASQINWKKLTKATDTLCVLMGMSNLEKIVQNLIENGSSPRTPVALIRWGTRPNQQTLIGTLENIVSKAREKEFKAPAVIVAGEVVNLREKLAWFEKKPLFNRRVVVTRARSQASALSERIKELGGEPVEFPTIKIAPPDSYEELDSAIENINFFNWLIFTSINGVEHFFNRFYSYGRDIRDLHGLKICAIGPKTKEGLLRKGLTVDVVPGEYRAEAVIESLKPVLEADEKILIPRAQVAREILPRALKEMGLNVKVAPVYKSIKDMERIPELKSLLKEGKIDAVTFTSSSTVENFVEIIGEGNCEEYMRSVYVACIGPITADTCKNKNIQVDSVAREYTIDGLVQVLFEGLAHV